MAKNPIPARQQVSSIAIDVYSVAMADIPMMA